MTVLYIRSLVINVGGIAYIKGVWQYLSACHLDLNCLLLIAQNRTNCNTTSGHFRLFTRWCRLAE